MACCGSILMQKYEIGKLLGQGTFAKVHHGRDIQSGKSVAIKIFDKDKVMRAGLMEQIKREISIMRMAEHPNIVRFHEVMASRGKIYFIMEYCKGGDLFSKLTSKVLTEDEARKYFQQLINAMEYCHSRGVYHRDLKPENLLLDEDGNLKVSDFGLSMLEEARRQHDLLYTSCGTPAYVAPEVILKKGYDGAKADIWSCGVVLYVLVARYFPFHGSNVLEMYKKIESGDFVCPHMFSSKLRRMLKRILDPDPASRASIPQIRGSSWFRKGQCSGAGSAPAPELSSRLTVPADVEISLGALGTEDGLVGQKKPTAIATLNAFDIISLSTGFDLSGFFVAGEHRQEARFTSKHSAPAIMSKMETVARRLRLKVKRKDDGAMRIATADEGRNGVIQLNVEIFEIAPMHHLVEMRKLAGDTFEYRRMFEEQLRPALKDIVWAWHGDHDQQQRRRDKAPAVPDSPYE